MKTILSAVDFSEASVNAAGYAADLAHATDSRLVLLHIFQVPVTASETPLPEPVFEDMLNDARQDLDRLASTLTARTNGKIIISARVEIGTVDYQLREFSKQENPFVVIMGLRASTHLERFLLGSHALSAIKHLPLPVLIVPDHFHFTPIKKIGLASDLAYAKALPYDRLAEWLSAFNASLDIVHVSKSEHSKSEELTESLSLENRLRKFSPAFHFLTGRNLQEKLAVFAKEHQLDLLIVVPRRHGIEDLFTEKHAQKIVINQQIPVLSLHVN